MSPYTDQYDAELPYWLGAFVLSIVVIMWNGGVGVSWAFLLTIAFCWFSRGVWLLGKQSGWYAGHRVGFDHGVQYGRICGERDARRDECLQKASS